jgi:hypothetical protein
MKDGYIWGSGLEWVMLDEVPLQSCSEEEEETCKITRTHMCII